MWIWFRGWKKKIITLKFRVCLLFQKLVKEEKLSPNDQDCLCVCVCVCIHTLMCISVILFLPHPPSSAQGLIKTRMHHAAFSSVSSPDIFFLNPPRKSPEVFEVLGCVNKDVTMVDTGLLNEDTRFDVRTLQCPKERDALQQTLPFPPSLSFFFFCILAARA